MDAAGTPTDEELPNLISNDDEVQMDLAAARQRETARTITEFFAEPHGKRNYEFLLSVAGARLWLIPQSIRSGKDAADLVQTVVEGFLDSESTPSRRKISSGSKAVAALCMAIRYEIYLMFGFVRRQNADGDRVYRPDPYKPRYEEIDALERERPGLQESEDAFLVELGKTYEDFRDSIPDYRVRELLDSAMDFKFGKSTVLARALHTDKRDIESRKKRLRRYLLVARKAHTEESTK